MKPNDLIRSLQKGMKARHRLQLKFFLSLMTFFAIIFIVGAILDHESAAFCMTGFGGVSTASMMAIGSVGDVSDKFTFGSNITYQVYLIDINQLDRSVVICFQISIFEPLETTIIRIHRLTVRCDLLSN